MKIKFDPTLITALSFFLTYLRKVKLIKHLIIRPITFIFNKLGRLFYLSKVIRNLRLYKIYRKITKVFSIFNILLATIFFLMFSDFTIEDLMILIALLYSKLYNFFTNNLLGYIYNLANIIKRKFSNLIDQREIDYIKNKINRNVNSSYPSPHNKMDVFRYTDIDYEIKEDKSKPSAPFYYSPYFYIPAILAITGVTIYYYHDSIPGTVTGILAYFGFNDDNTPRPSGGASKSGDAWIGDPSSSKTYDNAYKAVLNDPMFNPNLSDHKPRIKMSSRFDDALEGLRGIYTTQAEWSLLDPKINEPSSPTGSDSSAVSVSSESTLGKGKNKA